jgi:hypothetical protein
MGVNRLTAHQGEQFARDWMIHLVTLPGAYGRLPAFIAEFLLSGLLMGIVLSGPIIGA